MALERAVVRAVISEAFSSGVSSAISFATRSATGSEASQKGWEAEACGCRKGMRSGNFPVAPKSSSCRTDGNARTST